MSFDLKIQNFDLAIKNGDVQTLLGTDKLIQDIVKICLTEAGSNPMHPAYGSYVSKSIVGSVLEDNILITIAQSHLNTALENLKLLQEIQARSFQRVSPDELIASILEVSVQRNSLLPTLFDVRIAVAAKSFSQVQTQFNISVI